MTKDQYHISVPRQILFFIKYNISDTLHILYIGENSYGHAIGYGLISYDSDLQPWVSGGLIPKQRGKGYGSQLFKFLSEGWSMPVYLEVLKSNIYAHKLYANLGFVEVSRESRLLRSEHEPKHTDTVITMRKDV
jgi:ribosomal protein S18 acetylase RimI-like enzyme